MVKFRTMVVDADKRLADLAHLNEIDGGVLFKIRHDPRVTPVGRFPASVQHRRTSAVLQCTQRCDECRRSTSSIAQRGGHLRSPDPAAPLGAPRYHRPVAGERPLQPVVGRVRPAGYVLRRKLVDAKRSDDHDQHREGGARRLGGLLTVRHTAMDVANDRRDLIDIGARQVRVHRQAHPGLVQRL